MRYLNLLKKLFVLAVAALSIAIVNFKPVNAATMSEYYLQQIAQYTQQILRFLQDPANFAGVGVSLMQQDTGDDTITTKAQQTLAASGWQYTMSQQLVKALQRQLISDIIGKPMEDFSGKTPKILGAIPDVNALSFGSLLGVLPVQDAPFNAYDFVKIASSANTVRPIPSNSWQGNEDAKAKYKNYYNTVTAVESFNGYVLSEMAFQYALKANEMRDQLINMASSSDWIAKVATQELGRVFRQILLFESQNFVLNAQIEKNQRQMVAAQAMTNALLIKFNAINESELIRSAKGKDVSGAGY